MLGVRRTDGAENGNLPSFTNLVFIFHIPPYLKPSYYVSYRGVRRVRGGRVGGIGGGVLGRRQHALDRGRERRLGLHSGSP
jgi:hypothetical protein